MPPAARNREVHARVEIGHDIMNGKKPAESMTLLPSTLITRANVKDYKGWQAPR